ncbi:hypothetical protein HZS38_08435 [Xenorhabdus nematophila]|uniref:Uncharacterized protein n=1 Tax=Xenorhabdus nematophila (strain ATCC 19061 / DSM 3370 / CCUG 14189 / LMG 1036 / NCIMB 9965 / AN6) TaxID=406817 RepID=D3VD46_XENNA|nr:hypothetical protein [Xenorhabdus nematophila]CEF33728.1 conserved hypothetical protein; putative membrane protein [Xenorhabdus nematophila str. Websteri]AYA40439.1 hypothetical protein D3790_08270 [Xenorhabdus nematophila]KHD28517.1 hypothetical protein LH67_09940 [Xenorhabdus nematophila]MBA0019170.1 hypothetical protein [Xenorhabdus nematophila]MCB4425680.1 hypothetical protein [Xenorhabdus nematophila]
MILMYLTRKLVFFILYALMIAGVTGLLFLDVNYFHNGVGEDSLTEIFQALSLLTIAVLLFYEAKNNVRLRPALILMAGFFSCLLIRELDAYFDDILFHGAWSWLAIPLALICIGYACVKNKQSLFGLVHLTRHQSYSMMVCGLLCVLVFSRLFGIGVLWQGLMDEHFNRTVKNMVEEGCEMLGYAQCLIATLWYLPSARKQRSTENN